MSAAPLNGPPRTRGLARIIVAAVALLTTACAAPWQPLPEDERPNADRYLPGAVSHIVTPEGLARIASRAWDPLAVRYADGIGASIALRPVPDDRVPIMLYGPGRATATPTGFEIETGDDGTLTALVPLENAGGVVSLRLSTGSGQELACTARVTFAGARLRFRVSAVSAASGELGVSSEERGTLEVDDESVSEEDCAFPFTNERRLHALSIVRRSIEDALETERSAHFAPSLVSALSPTLQFGAILSSEEDGASTFVLASVLQSLFDPLGANVANRYRVAVAISSPRCQASELSRAPSVPPTPLPERDLAPDGEPYDEAIVLSREILQSALQALCNEDLTDSLLAQSRDDAEKPRAPAILQALWPSETPPELLRVRGDDFAIRLRIDSSPASRTDADTDDIAWPAAEIVAAPNAPGDPIAPVHVRFGSLTVEIYGSVAGTRLRLLTLRAERAAFDIVPTLDEDGLLRLGVSRFQTEKLGADRGLLALAHPTAEWIAQLLDAVLASYAILDLGVLGDTPGLAGASWYEDRSYALYLRLR